MSLLNYQIKKVTDLVEADYRQMFALMEGAYANVQWTDFLADVAQKNWVICLRDENDQLQGFSTVQLYSHQFNNEPINVVYSGDTIIAPEHWGSLQLPLAFGKLLQKIKSRDSRKLFWLLISKGIRTYRFLPVFFREFHPHYQQETPGKIQVLMDSLAKGKFGDQYSNGLVKAAANAQFLLPALDGADEKSKRQDPHIEFFLDKNPAYHKGDELLCLTEFREDNITDFIRKRLTKKRDVCLL